MTNLEFYEDEIRGKLCVFPFRRAICEVLNVDYDRIDDQELLDWLTKEHKMAILSEEERAYIQKVIEPFREKIISISKSTYKNSEYLSIYYDEGQYTASRLQFPNFKKGERYKGMQPNKEYSLTELGL